MVVRPLQFIGELERFDVSDDRSDAVLGDQPRSRRGEHSKVPTVLCDIADIFLCKQLKGYCVELRYVIAPLKERVLVLAQLAKALGEINIPFMYGMAYVVGNQRQSMQAVVLMAADVDFDLKPALGILAHECRVYRSDESFDSSSICMNNVSVVLGDEAWWGPGIGESAKYVRGDAGIHVRSLLEKLSKMVPWFVTGVATGPCEEDRRIPCSRVCSQCTVYHDTVPTVSAMHIDIGGANPVIEYKSTPSAYNITIMIGSAIVTHIALTRTWCKQHALHGFLEVFDGSESVGFGVTASPVEEGLSIAPVSNAGARLDFTGLSVSGEPHVSDMGLAREWCVPGNVPTLYNNIYT